MAARNTKGDKDLSISDFARPVGVLAQANTGWLELNIPELPPIFGLLAVLVLVGLNGFFVATEFALVAVRRSRIEQLVAEGHRTAPIVRNALQHLDTYIAATQLGITMASLALGWIGEPALAIIIDPVLETVLPRDWAVTGSHAISVAVSFALITALHIVLGELAPKGVALQRPEGTALVVSVPIRVFMRIFRPFIMFLNGVGNLVLRLIGFHPASGEESVHTVEELRYLVRSSREAGLLEKSEEDIASRALDFGDLAAHSVMVPRTEMTTVPQGIGREEFLALAGREHHTRFPVYAGTRDNIVGIAHVTDVLDWEFAHRGELWSMETTMRKPLLVPETVKANHLMSQMRAARTHTAIAVDEFGGVAGLVTLQDIVERIVGNIPEADEQDQTRVEMLPDGSAVVSGLLPVDDFAARFGVTLGESDADTVGGYVLEMLGRVPAAGNELVLGPYIMRVTEMDGPRIARILVRREAPGRGEEEEDELTE